MKKIAAALILVILIVSSVVFGIAYLRDVDDTDNRLLCEIREDLGFRDEEPLTCFEIYG